MVKKKTSRKSYLPNFSITLPKWTGWLLIPASFIVVFFIYNLFFWAKIFPGVYLAQTYVGGLTVEEAERVLNNNPTPDSIKFSYNSQEFNVPAKDVGLLIDYHASADSAYQVGREENLFVSLYKRGAAPFAKTRLGLAVDFDNEALDKNLGAIAEQVSLDPVYPSVKLVGKELVVEKGGPGSTLDKELLITNIKDFFSFGKYGTISLPVTDIDPSLSDVEAMALKTRAQKLMGKKIIINLDNEIIEWREDKIFPMISPKGGYVQEEIKIKASELSHSLNRDPQNPTFIFDGGRVKEFAPSQDGLMVEEEKLTAEILTALTRLEEEEPNEISLEVPLIVTSPKIKTSEVNNLGINELVGRGVSHFAHSIPNRIYNISLATSKFKGVLIAPGAVFSFNDVLGDVSALTGYKQAFVIKDGKTVLGDGGGVCQVSTTLFRAILDAGLPVVERKAHSYRVSYYEQGSPPGIDATVYAPTADLKFRNDTPGHLLIQPSLDTKTTTLIFEIYGTSDGRVAKTTKPVVSGVTPPPEDLYVDDPTLPLGIVKQIDFKAWGAKVSFTYTVERFGKTVYKNTFVSNYRPWQAVYLRGTQPI